MSNIQKTVHITYELYQNNTFGATGVYFKENEDKNARLFLIFQFHRVHYLMIVNVIIS